MFAPSHRHRRGASHRRAGRQRHQRDGPAVGGFCLFIAMCVVVMLLLCFFPHVLYYWLITATKSWSILCTVYKPFCQKSSFKKSLKQIFNMVWVFTTFSQLGEVSRTCPDAAPVVILGEITKRRLLSLWNPRSRRPMISWRLTKCA